jgi:hypothetical protein
MSQENVELVRGAFALMTIPGDPETMIAASDPGFEMHLVQVGGGAAYYAGASGILGDRVLVLGDVRGRGRVSGIEVDDHWAWIVELREGRAVSLRGFLDQRDGMAEQMKTLANLGLLSRFVGMLTDSRSFVSYPRHEYFRRILCDIIGTWVENGEYPNDMEFLKAKVRDICFNNAKQYFDM